MPLFVYFHGWVRPDPEKIDESVFVDFKEFRRDMDVIPVLIHLYTQLFNFVTLAFWSTLVMNDSREGAGRPPDKRKAFPTSLQ